MMMGIKKYLVSYKNNNLRYYIGCISRELYPTALCRMMLNRRLAELAMHDLPYISSRLNYYNKLAVPTPLLEKSIPLGGLKLPERKRVYYFDTFEFTRYFPKQLKANFLFGDITHVPGEPSITKSRPVKGDNKNSVILKLEKKRHFMYVKYDKPFVDKKNMLVWRGVTGSASENRQHRVRFLEMHFNSSLCNIGKVGGGLGPDEWMRGRLTIDEQLEYKFILCIEGNDVASNLKWVLSSNSLAVMPKPKYETWFMEGTLIPDYHYVAIKDDYSDLEERLQYYIEHTDKALEIIKNAHDYVDQFRHKKREDLLSLLVLEKYFVKTGQMDPISSISY